MTIHHPSLDIQRHISPRMIRAYAAHHPDTIAIHDGTAAISYAMLEQRGLALAAILSAAGAGHGDLIAVCMTRSAQQIIVLYAAWLMGAAYLPLDPDWPDSRLASLLTRSRAKLLVMPPDRAATVAQNVTQNAPVIDPFAADISSGTAPASVSFAPDDLAPDDLAYVIYTSGSTGEPKAVEITHANLAALVHWHIRAFALHPDMRASHLAGLAFDAAVWEVWPVLASGGTLILPQDETLRYDAPRLATWLVEQHIEIAFAPTLIAEQLINQEWPDTAALRTLLTGADRLKLRPRPTLPFSLVNNYGPTECTVVATSGIVGQGQGFPPIGLPITGTKLYIVNPSGEEVPPGAEGEIWIAGPQVARGYRDDPALTAERFLDHPHWGWLYRTGDRARQDPHQQGQQGQIHFIGRMDAQVKLRGHRIEPAEIETALLQIEGIDAAAVTVRDDALIAWVVPATGSQLAATAIREHLARELPAVMLPSCFVHIDALPLNANGKLDRAILPDPALSSLLPETSPGATAPRAPSTPTERRLTDIIATVIGRDDFGVDDDFFLLGGHSLLGTQVIVKAREAFGVELTLLHLFEARTVTRLAAVIADLVIAHLASMSDDDIARMIER